MQPYIQRVSDEEEQSSAEVMEQMGTAIGADDMGEEEDLEDDDIEEDGD